MSFCRASLISSILAKLFKAGSKEVSKGSVTSMGKPRRAWELEWWVWGAEHGSPGAGSWRALPWTCCPSTWAVTCGRAWLQLCCKREQERLQTNSWVSKEKAHLYLSLAVCVVGVISFGSAVGALQQPLSSSPGSLLTSRLAMLSSVAAAGPVFHKHLIHYSTHLHSWACAVSCDSAVHSWVLF